MSYSVKPGSGWGRIGEGLGKGLSEQFMPAFQQGRLAAGLKSLAETGKNLSPTQRFAQLASIPGITPQMMQTYGELLQRERLGEGFRALSGEEGGAPVEGGATSEPGATPQPKGVPGMMQRRGAAPEGMPDEGGKQRYIVGESPVREAAIPRKPWSSQKRNTEREKINRIYPEWTKEQIDQEVNEREARWLSQPEAEQKIDQYLRERRDQALDDLDAQLLNKLQKGEKGALFKDISGASYEALRRKVENEVAQSPETGKSVSEIVNKWSDKALEMGRTNSQLEKLQADSQVFAGFFGNEAYKNKLKSYAKIYRDFGAEEDYYNKLKGDFGLSPQSAASIAYPISGKMNSVLEKKPKGMFNWQSASTKRAEDVLNNITPADSVLSIASKLRKSDPFFSETVFFDYLRNNMDNLTDRQKREIAEGGQFLRSWADLWLGLD